MINFVVVYFLLFQIAKAKAESRIECLRNGDGNGTYNIFYSWGILTKGLLSFTFFLSYIFDYVLYAKKLKYHICVNINLVVFYHS